MAARLSSPRRLLGAVAATIGLAVATLASPAGAVGAVDQQQPVADSSVLVVPGLLQTFTVGTTGRLDAIQLTSPNGGPAVVQLYRIGSPLPGTALLPTNLSVAFMPGQLTTIGLGGGIPVTAGDQIGIAVGGVRSTSAVELNQATGDRYASGTLYRVNTVYSFTELVGADLQFATFVTAPAKTDLTVPTLKSTKGRPTATLTVGATGAPVAGRTITFALTTANGSVKATCTATTASNGVASCPTKWSIPSGGSMTASFAGDVDYAPSSGSTSR